MTTEWNSTLESGIDEIDAQHKDILVLLDKLINIYTPTGNSYEFTDTFIDFSEAVRKHFAYEEKLLAKSKFKGLKQHKEGHEEISDLLNSISMSIMLDEKNIPFQSIDKVIKWFDEHLKSEDVKYFKNVVAGKN